MELCADDKVMVSGMTTDIVDEDLLVVSNPSKDNLNMDDGFSEYVDNEIQALGGVKDYPMPLVPQRKLVINATNMSISDVYHEMNGIAFGGKLPTLSHCCLSPFFQNNCLVKRPDGTIVLSMKLKENKAEQLKLLFALMGRMYQLQCGPK